MIIHHKACNEVQIYFHIGGKVEKSLNKHTKGYKGHLFKKKQLVDELLINTKTMRIHTKEIAKIY